MEFIKLFENTNCMDVISLWELWSLTLILLHYKVLKSMDMDLNFTITKHLVEENLCYGHMILVETHNRYPQVCYTKASTSNFLTFFLYNKHKKMWHYVNDV